MGRNTDTVEKLFFQGDYQGALAQSLDHPSKKWALRDLAAIVGSLCFLGRPEEGETLLNDRLDVLTDEARIQGRFFLALGFTRKSDYPRARRYLALNLRELRGKTSFKSQVFIYQGLSFYRYFCGKWRLALKDAQLAFDAAVRSDFLYGRVLSADLRGHLLIQMGEVPLGLHVLRQAQTLAHQIGNANVAQAIELARVGYEAQFGLSPGKTIERLRKHAKTAASLQDTYSHSSILLELARQYLIRGLFAQATAVLDQAGYLIYSHRNRRQEVSLCLRYAYLSHLSGDPARGLSFIQSGKRALDPEVDHALRLSLLGMEEKLVRALGLNEKSEHLQAELRAESRTYGGSINRRILARACSASLTQALAGDPLGTVLDSLILGEDEATEAVLKSGYFGLLLELRPERRGRELILLDLEEHSVTAIDRSGVEHVKGLTSLLRHLLRELAQGERTKPQLIRAIWKYPSYHPLKHNPVIYQGVTALRKLLGSHADWIQTTEEGYRLREGVEVRFESAPELKPLDNTLSSADALNVPADASAPESLNHRQIQFLRSTRSGEYVSVHDYRKSHKISELTACRDLGDLKRLGLVLRVGKARATRYLVLRESKR